MDDAAWAAWRLFGGFAVALGLIVGSFLNVCIARLPEDRSVVHPPSHCPSCGAGIRPVDNVPVLSWVLLRGRCRACKSPISSLYPTIELLTGLLALLLFWRAVPDPTALTAAHGVYFVGQLVFVSLLLVAAYVDVRHYIIPDEVSIYAVPAGVLLHLGLGALGHPDALPWQQTALGAFFGGGSLVTLMAMYWLVRRREAFGWGDPKLLAMIGAFAGPLPALPFVLFVASLGGAAVGLALVVGRRRAGWGLGSALPFGPFLAFGGVLWALRGPELVERWFPGLHYLIAVGGGP